MKTFLSLCVRNRDLFATALAFYTRHIGHGLFGEKALGCAWSGSPYARENTAGVRSPCGLANGPSLRRVPRATQPCQRLSSVAVGIAAAAATRVGLNARRCSTLRAEAGALCKHSEHALSRAPRRSPDRNGRAAAKKKRKRRALNKCVCASRIMKREEMSRGGCPRKL